MNLKKNYNEIELGQDWVKTHRKKSSVNPSFLHENFLRCWPFFEQKFRKIGFGTITILRKRGSDLAAVICKFNRSDLMGEKKRAITNLRYARHSSKKMFGYCKT